MKNVIIAFSLLFIGRALCGQSLYAQEHSLHDAIIGEWYTEHDKSIVEIWKVGNTYCGKIVWLKDSLESGKPKIDKHNPNEQLRARPIIGLQILAHLRFDYPEWVQGTIYDPENGKEYSCKAYLRDGKLDLRGYVLGMPFLGRTTTWRRKHDGGK